MSENIRKVEISPELVRIIDKIVVQNQTIINQNAKIIECFCNPQWIYDSPKPQDTKDEV